MKRYIAITLFLLCTSCQVSQVAIHPVPAPVPASRWLGSLAYDRMEDKIDLWFGGECYEKKCEE